MLHERATLIDRSGAREAEAIRSHKFSRHVKIPPLAQLQESTRNDEKLTSTRLTFPVPVHGPARATASYAAD